MAATYAAAEFLMGSAPSGGPATGVGASATTTTQSAPQSQVVVKAEPVDDLKAIVATVGRLSQAVETLMAQGGPRSQLGLSGNRLDPRLTLSGGPATGPNWMPPLPRPPMPGCLFCGASDHMIRWCPEVNKYIAKGWATRTASGQVALPGGQPIPWGKDRIKERIDEYHTAQGGPPAVAGNRRNMPSHLEPNLLETDPPQLEIFHQASSKEQEPATVHTAANTLKDANATLDQLTTEELERIWGALREALVLAQADRNGKNSARGYKAGPPKGRKSQDAPAIAGGKMPATGTRGFPNSDFPQCDHCGRDYDPLNGEPLQRRGGRALCSLHNQEVYRRREKGQTLERHGGTEVFPACDDDRPALVNHFSRDVVLLSWRTGSN
ncbi:hypothetical protein K474DRAFT_1675197 [Panus rudis PR-1116 ss-1]|nr:hypothetical protein K474DRAFT_1675197 [Panus rudis PR-1116 ss-1]